MRSITRIPTAPTIAALLDRVPALGPEHVWEGALDGASGSASSWTLKVRAHIAFHGGLIEGTGRMETPPAVDGAVDTFGLVGTRDGDGVAFALWFDTPAISHVPIETTGRLSADGRTMTGDWTIGCFYPDTCGCTGGGGTYRLERVD
ncbi:MAG: hypothetical protein HC834_03930 [Rhodospirillales bacterium]|nr:hypothetical protein [Rhodospirillales bacterium]